MKDPKPHTYKITSRPRTVYHDKDEAFAAAIEASKQTGLPQLLMGISRRGTLANFTIVCSEQQCERQNYKMMIVFTESQD